VTIKSLDGLRPLNIHSGQTLEIKGIIVPIGENKEKSLVTKELVKSNQSLNAGQAALTS